MVAHEPPDEIALGRGSGSVHDTWVEHDDRQPIGSRASRHIPRRAPSCAGNGWPSPGAGCRLAEARGTTRCRRPAASAECARAASTDCKPPMLMASNSEGSRRQTATSAARVTDRVGRLSRARDGACVTNISRDRRASGMGSAARTRPARGPPHVSRDDRGAKIAGAAGNENSHEFGNRDRVIG